MACLSWGQSNCPLPPVVEKGSRALNIFSDQQESDLGDLMAEPFAADNDILHSEQLTAHIRQIGDRLVRYLPPNQFRFQYFLIDIPEVNAFSIAGGHIYVSRKLVALAKSDDELAGILAHELGHIVTHQTGIEMTRRLREVLKVTEVGDRDDIREKYFRFLENEARKPDRKDNEAEDQLIADQVAVYAMARAGYAPRAYIEIWDRFQQTHGKTGNWLSDFFGGTKPSEKRLREMLKSVSSMPAGCADITSATDPGEFAKWQTEVVSFRSSTLEESLPGLVFKQKLALPLRPDITNLKFSPDGKRILAQDEGGIHVLTRDPLTVVFFIDAPDAERASFSADSRSVTFLTSSLRIEIWDIATRQRTAVHEMVLNQGCLQSDLSPDGAHLACLRDDFSLVLIDVASGEEIIKKKDFFEIYNYWSWVLYAVAVSEHRASFAHMGFSPDGRYFLAGSIHADFSYDFQQKRAVSMPGSIRDLLRYSFAFLGPDRIVGININAAQKSPVLSFPSGKRLLELPLSASIHLGAPGHGDFVLVGPLREKPLGILDLNSKQLFVTFEHEAGDIYDNWLISERTDGKLALTDLAAKKDVGAIQLEQSLLGGTTTVSVSPGLHWLAVSSRSRGAIWNLEPNIRLYHTHSFQAAWFANENELYADFLKHDKIERQLVRADLAADRTMSQVRSLEKTTAAVYGPYLLIEKPENEKSYERKNWTMEIEDYRSNKTVWTRQFPHEVPNIFLSPANSTALMIWPLTTGAGREELAHFLDLKPKAAKEDFLIELLDFQKNTPVGTLVVKTNKNRFVIERISFDQDWVALLLEGDRILLYSLKTGEQRGRFFGYEPKVSSTAGVIAITKSTGQLQLYDLSSSQLQHEYKFPSAVSYKTFSPDGKRLFVFTRDQTAYILDLTAAH